MGMGDCLRCIKYLLFVFNLIFCLIGLAILAIGIWMYVKPADTAEFLQEYLHSVQYSSIFLIVIGSIITVLGFLGCCGAIFENRCLLVFFFILLLIVFLILLAAGIGVLVWKQQLVENFEAQFTILVKNQTIADYKNRTDYIQSQLNCCGANKADKDYTDQHLQIPESCKPAAGKTHVSCTKLIGDSISSNSIHIAIGVFVTAIVALTGMVFSMMLCCAIHDLA